MQVVQRLLRKAREDKLLQFRHCARFLPCTHICRADKDAISSLAETLVGEQFDCGVHPPPLLCFAPSSLQPPSCLGHTSLTVMCGACARRSLVATLHMTGCMGCMYLFSSHVWCMCATLSSWCTHMTGCMGCMYLFSSDVRCMCATLSRPAALHMTAVSDRQSYMHRKDMITISDPQGSTTQP